MLTGDWHTLADLGDSLRPQCTVVKARVGWWGLLYVEPANPHPAARLWAPTFTLAARRARSRLATYQ